MTSIAIMTIYIGKFPDWIDLWIESVGRNDSIDFFLLTDQGLNIDIPDNLKVIKTDLIQLKARFSKALGFECELSKPYKLCDYKPIYGLTFKELISGYDFWGHCDVDMVFGNLRKFLTEDILSSYDRIFEVGHLTLYRNSEIINNVYKCPGGMIAYNKVFKEKPYCGFDEHTGITRVFRKHCIPTYNEVVCADIDPHYRAFYMMDEDTVDGHMRNRNYPVQAFGVIDGSTWQIALGDNKLVKNEVSYIHFMRKYPINAKKCIGKDYLVTYKEFIPIIKHKLSKDFIIKNSYATKGLCKKTEYVCGFIKNGWMALRRGELFLRIRLRIGRVNILQWIHDKI